MIWNDIWYGETYSEAKKYMREDDTMTKETGVSVTINGRTYIIPHVNFIQRIGERPQVVIPEIDVSCPVITNVIFNPPATIVFWSDKTKTVVKCDYSLEFYDPEKGIAMAISRKMIGDNKREYYNTFKHWLKKWDKQPIGMHDMCETPEPTDSTEAKYEWNGDMCNA